MASIYEGVLYPSLRAQAPRYTGSVKLMHTPSRQPRSTGEIGSAYFTSDVAAIPEFAFPSARARRQFQMGQSAYDQLEQELLADAMFKRGIIEQEFPRKLTKLRDAIAGRGLTFSGIRTQAESDLQRQRLFDLGAIERELALALAQAKVQRALAGVGYSDTLEDALVDALRAEQQATVAAVS